MKKKDMKKSKPKMTWNTEEVGKKRTKNKKIDTRPQYKHVGYRLKEHIEDREWIINKINDPEFHEEIKRTAISTRSSMIITDVLLENGYIDEYIQLVERIPKLQHGLLHFLQEKENFIYTPDMMRKIYENIRLFKETRKDIVDGYKICAIYYDDVELMNEYLSFRSSTFSLDDLMRAIVNSSENVIRLIIDKYPIFRDSDEFVIKSVISYIDNNPPSYNEKMLPDEPLDSSSDSSDYSSDYSDSS